MDTTDIGTALSAWEDLGPTQRLPSFVQQRRPSARTLEIAGKLGLRYPPANSVDRESHAARVALLAEDCADIDPDLLDAAARDWARREPFFPRTCELRELSAAIRRLSTPSPKMIEAQPPKPEEQPLTPEDRAEMNRIMKRFHIRTRYFDDGSVRDLMPGEDDPVILDRPPA